MTEHLSNDRGATKARTKRATFSSTSGAVFGTLFLAAVTWFTPSLHAQSVEAGPLTIRSSLVVHGPVTVHGSLAVAGGIFVHGSLTAAWFKGLPPLQHGRGQNTVHGPLTVHGPW